MELLIAPNSVPLAGADLMPTSGTPQYATDGNPATGVPATQAPASHYNMMMAELTNFVIAGGLTPSGSDWGQLLKSGQALFGITNNLQARGTPGYAKLPSGLIIQSFPTPIVNVTTVNSATPYSFTFPIAFPNKVVAIFGSDSGFAATTWGSFAVTLNGGTGYVWSIGGGGVTGYIMAIGG